MNQSFYESRRREKINDLMKEGITSQAYQRSKTPKAKHFPRMPKLLMIILGFLGWPK